MRQRTSLAVATFLAAAFLHAQQPNLPFSSLAVNASPSDAFGPGPTTAATFTDSPITINVRGAPNAPLAIFHGPLELGVIDLSTPQTTFLVDIARTGSTYANQFLVNGFAFPNSGGFTNSIAEYSLSIVVPACVTSSQGVTTCTTVAAFSRAVQALTVDPSAAPFGVRTTGATQVDFTNGYRRYVLSNNGNAKIVFRDGFTFPFYGQTYASTAQSPTSQSVFVYANGYISFGANPPSPMFQDPSVGFGRSGPRRIFTYFSDLEPQDPSWGPSVTSQQFIENGIRKLRIVHSRLAEFANVTGPHGGEVLLDEFGNIEINVHNYQVNSSIDVMVGIARGQGGTQGSGGTAFGRDLSADAAAAGTQLAGPNDEAFELFDHGNGTACTNCIDLIGAPAIKFTPTPGAGYMISN